MTSPPRTAIVVAFVCLSLTSCGDKGFKGFKRGGVVLKPGDLLVDLSDQEKDHPDQRAFCELCAKLTVGMSEQDVDAIMVTYSSQPKASEGLRPGFYCKVYTKCEEEYVPKLIVCFDDTHVARIGLAIDDVAR